MVSERLRTLTEEEEQELAKLTRRDLKPKTLEELIAWEREFGSENEAENERANGHPVSPELRREFYKSYAHQFDVPYTTVKAAVERARIEGEAAKAVDERPFIRLSAPAFAARIRSLDKRLRSAERRLAKIRRTPD